MTETRKFKKPSELTDEEKNSILIDLFSSIEHEWVKSRKGTAIEWLSLLPAVQSPRYVVERQFAQWGDTLIDRYGSKYPPTNTDIGCVRLVVKETL